MNTKNKIKTQFLLRMLEEWKSEFSKKAFKMMQTTDESTWDQSLRVQLGALDQHDAPLIIEIYKTSVKSVIHNEANDQQCKDNNVLTFDEWFNDPDILLESKMWGELAKKAELK